MPQGSRSAPEQFHPYLGKTYGNILDQYDSSTYNAKLYILMPALRKARLPKPVRLQDKMLVHQEMLIVC